MEETYESHTEYPECTNTMKQHPHAKDLDVDHADYQVVHKVPRCEPQDERGGTGVPIYALGGVHGFPFLIREHHPEGDDIDHAALDKGHDPDIPVCFGAAIELWVEARGKQRRQPRRDVQVNEKVKGESAEGLMDVV